MAGKRVYAFCGVGNPVGFFKRLEAMGALLVGSRALDDHHAYEAAELGALLAEARAAGAEAVVTTQKDAVKLAPLPGAEQVLVLKIRVAIRAGEADLERALDGALARAASEKPSDFRALSRAVALRANVPRGTLSRFTRDRTALSYSYSSSSQVAPASLPGLAPA
jgi:hypothetical protein